VIVWPVCFGSAPAHGGRLGGASKIDSTFDLIEKNVIEQLKSAHVERFTLHRDSA
jgi:hypothetical protein